MCLNVTVWELLLVDDGSSDASPAIAADFAARDGRIVAMRSAPDRRGAAAARNAGIAAARGDYVSFLDCDDLYEPGMLAAHVAALDADPQAAWVYSATRWFHEDGSRRDYRERLGLRLDRRYPPPVLLNRIILEERGDIPCTCSVMIRKAALDEVGGFEERFKLYEDQSLWVKLLLAYPVRVISGCHAAYRQHGGSTSSAATASGTYSRTGGHRARTAFLEWVGDYVRERGAPPSVDASVDTALRANDGRLWDKLLRRVRVMNRLLY